MKTYLVPILSMMIFSFSSLLHAGISASGSMEEIDGQYVWTITLSSDVGEITAIDYLAKSNSNFADYDLVFYDSLFNDMPTPQSGPGVDTRFLFSTPKILDLRSHGFDTHEKLAAVFGVVDPFEDKDVARISILDNTLIFDDPDFHPMQGFGLDIYALAGGEQYRIFQDEPFRWPTVCEDRAAIGDFDCNLQTDLADLTTLGENYNQPGGYNDGDTNGDGFVDLMDLITLGKYYFLISCQNIQYGDFNCDDEINLLDLVIMDNHYRTAVPAYTLGDWDGSGFVDLLDFDVMFRNFNTPTPIPEPAALGVIGLGGLLLVSRRK